MPEIKTRDAVRGSIKALDKSAIVSKRMKDSLVKVKERSENSIRAKESSPEEYAGDKITGGTEIAVSGGIELAQKARRDERKTISSGKKQGEARKSEMPREQAKKTADENTKVKREVAQEGGLSSFEPTLQQSASPSSYPSVVSSDTQQSIPNIRIKERESSAIPIKTRDSVQQSISRGHSQMLPPDRFPSTTTRPEVTIEQRTQIKVNPPQKELAIKNVARSTARNSQRTSQTARKAAAESAQAAKKAAETASKAARRAIAETKALISSLTAGGAVAVFVMLLVVLLGVAVALFGRRSSTSSYTPVSPEVEAYTPIITIYAKQHGIPEYVELIKAVMMQESGGQGGDPMQCSESGYNTRYPHAPNSITDPEYSINVGVQTLADVLRMAGAESPIDLDRVSLALQGYNYGPGYITWALARYGGYSEMNAIEFSNMMAAQYGWAGYGDKAYVSHVLRYYPLGRIFFGEGNLAIVEVAKSQLGNSGGLLYCEWYGYPYRVEWCAIFVSWCADQCGFLEAGVLPRMEGVIPYVEWFQQRGQWQDRSYEPMAGDIIFFDWESDGLPDHVGIVDKCEGGMVYTMEGNANDACVQNRYYLASSPIFGYGLPLY